MAATLSFVFPGAGQLYLGRRVSAVVFFVPALVAVLWAALQLSQGLVYFAVSLLDDTYALTVMVVAVAFTAWRVTSIAHPFLVVRPRRIGLRTGAVLALLLIATVGMGDVVFSNAFDAYSASRQIASNDFTDATQPETPDLWTPDPDWTFVLTGSGGPSSSPTEEISPTPGPTCPPSYMQAQRIPSNAFAAPAAASPEPSPSTPVPSPTVGPTESSSPLPSPTPEITPSPTPEITPSPTPEITPSPTPEITPSPSPTGGPGSPTRLTVVLVGVDFMAGRSHALTDSLMLVSVDLQTRAVAMVSVPRDTSAFPFYWGGQAPDNFKINALANAIAAGRFGSPDPPLVTLANEIGFLVGVKIDYYAEIDMDGFKQMIDLIGGVDINNPSVLNDPFTCTYVPAGLVHLDGSMALRYVRSRESTNDYSRASRQQIVLMALEKKMATPAMLPKLGSLLALAGKSIATNFPLKTAKDYVYTAEHISSIAHCVLGPPYNFHPDSKLTNGTWTSRLKLDQVANLSVQFFGTESRYYGQPGVVPAPCQNRF
ncbi:MAG: LCP family protein [Candidatus Limnocylindrales bacterium]